MRNYRNTYAPKGYFSQMIAVFLFIFFLISGYFIVLLVVPLLIIITPIVIDSINKDELERRNIRQFGVYKPKQERENQEGILENQNRRRINNVDLFLLNNEIKKLENEVVSFKRAFENTNSSIFKETIERKQGILEEKTRRLKLLESKKVND